MIDYNIRLIVIDSFCGAGGVTEGFHRAEIDGVKVCKVIIGINHDEKAIQSHAANHPDTIHFIEDFTTLDPNKLRPIVDRARELYPNAKVLFWMSAECTHHSKAKGGLPRDADSRSLPEHAERYVKVVNPDIIGVENVVEFIDWGPLDVNGKPVKEQKGIYYNAWRDTLINLGYEYDFKKLNAADFGAYTSRVRYFGVFAKDQENICFPVQTHHKTGANGLEKWKAVKDVLNLEVEGESIFSREKPLVDATLNRIIAGIERFVINNISIDKPTRTLTANGAMLLYKVVSSKLNESAFKFSCLSKGKAYKTPSIRRHTLTATRGNLEVVQSKSVDFMVKYNSMSQRKTYKAPSINEPSPTVSCQARIGVSSSKFISKAFSGRPQNKNISIDQPSGAITTVDHHQMITAYYGNGYNSSVEEPCGTVTTKDRFGLVSSKFISSYNFKDKPRDLDKPFQTLTCKDRFSIISAYYSPGYNSSLLEPVGTLTTKDRFSKVTFKFIASSYSGGGQISDINSPNPSLLTVPKQQVVSAQWLLDTQFGNKGRDINQPGPTITANRKQFYLMNPQFNNKGGSIHKPCFTLIARMDKMPPYLIETKTGGVKIQINETDSEVMKQLKTICNQYGIIDIMMRMLMIEELLRIQGFGDQYILKGTKADMKKFIGNAVECKQARALAESLASTIKQHLYTETA